MVKPGTLGGEDASFPLGGMVQAPHGPQGLCGGGTDWLLAGSLGRRVELSAQSQEDRPSHLSLAFIAVGGVDQSRCRLNLPCLVHCSSPGPLAGESRLPSISSLFYFFFATPTGIYGLLAFSVPSQGFMQEKAGNSQPFALCPMLICSLLYLLVS